MGHRRDSRNGLVGRICLNAVGRLLDVDSRRQVQHEINIRHVGAIDLDGRAIAWPERRFTDAIAGVAAPDLVGQSATDAILGIPGFFRGVFRQHNVAQRGSSGRFERFTLLATPLGLDRGETTDKGYVNQSAVLSQRADVVEKLYADPPPDEIVVVDG